MLSSAADFEVPTPVAACSFRNFKSKAALEIICLLVPLCFPSSCQMVPPCFTNFGRGAPVPARGSSHGSANCWGKANNFARKQRQKQPSGNMGRLPCGRRPYTGQRSSPCCTLSAWPHDAPLADPGPLLWACADSAAAHAHRSRPGRLVTGGAAVRRGRQQATSRHRAAVARCRSTFAMAVSGLRNANRAKARC